MSVVRRAADELARHAGFADTRAGQTSLIVTELATNILKHAQRGEILLTQCRAGSRRGVEVLAVDWGAGFRNVDAALSDGYSSAGTLGQGLGAVRRIADEFEVFSQATKGAVVFARIWVDAGAPDRPAFQVGGISIAKTGEVMCGDQWSAEVGRHHAAMIVADGLGHGPIAAEASIAAINVFERDPMRSPTATLEEVHQALRPTRGAAVGIAAIEFERDIAVFAGLGNITAAIVSGSVRRSLVSQNGTAGHVARRLQEFTYPMPPASALVLHSDGLTTHWDPGGNQDLWLRHPSIIAGALYRDCSRRRDDVTVVVGTRRRE